MGSTIGIIGFMNALLTLKNPCFPEYEPVRTEALVDTGSVYLIISEHIRRQLGLEEQAQKEITLADDSKKLVP